MKMWSSRPAEFFINRHATITNIVNLNRFQNTLLLYNNNLRSGSWNNRLTYSVSLLVLLFSVFTCLIFC